MYGSSLEIALNSIDDVIPVIASNFQAEIGSLRSINALDIATVGLVRFAYPVPPKLTVKDDILDDVETCEVTIPGSTFWSSKIVTFLSDCINLSIALNTGNALFT